MKLLANENIPLLAVKKLREHGYDVFSISEQISGITDNEVLNLSKQEDRIIITFDRDYGELIFLRKMTSPPAIIYLHFIPQNPIEVFEIIEAVLKMGESHLLNQFITVNRQYVRKRPLPL